MGLCVRRWICLIPVAGLVSLVLFGVLGYGRLDPSSFDMRVLYGAGALYLEGLSPYGPPRTPEKLKDIGLEMWVYAYPPHASPLVMGLASLGFDVAKALVVVLNVGACVLLALLVTRFMRAESHLLRWSGGCAKPRADAREGRPAASRSTPAYLRGERMVDPGLTARAVVAGAIIGSPFTAHVVWLGNTTIVVAAALTAAWLCDRENRPVLAGCFLAIAAIKPQFALLAGLWLLMERRWVTVASAAALVAAMSAAHIVQFGLLGSVRLWFEGLESYVSFADQDYIGQYRRMGMAAFLESISIDERLAFPLAGGALFALWRFRSLLTRLDLLASLCTLSILFLPSHNYDLVILAPLAGALAMRAQGHTQLQVLAAIALLLLFVPQRYVALLGIEPLTLWRIPLVAFLQFLLFAPLIAAAGGRSAGAAAETAVGS